MPIKVKQEDGSEIDAYTAEELSEQATLKAKEASEAAVAAEQERLKGEHEADIAAREQASAADKEELEKFRNKDFNFEKLRNSKTLTPEQEAEAKRVADDLKKTNERLDAIEQRPFETAKQDFLKSNIGVDKDLQEKFDFFFKQYGSKAKTVEEYKTAMGAAFYAATDGKKQPNTSSAMIQTSVDPNFGGDGGAVESQDSQAFGQMLGITAEDKKTYAAAVKTGTVPLFNQSKPKEKSV